MKKIVVIITLSLIVGCAGPNWASRVETYSIEDAKRDYGPADKCEDLNKNETVCSWKTSIGRNWIDKLILTFDKNHLLTSGNERRF